MRLANKMMSLMFFMIISLLAIDGYLSVQREVKLFENDMKRDALLLGHALKGVLADVWRISGKSRVLELIDQANKDEKQVTIRWVWLDAPTGDPFEPHVSQKKLKPITRGQEISFKETGKNGTGFFYTYIPVSLQSQRSGALELSESLSDLNNYTRESITRSFALGILMALVSWFIFLMVDMWVIGSRVDQLVEKMERIGAGDFSGDLSLSGDDELADLAKGINRMCGLLSSREKEKN